MTATTPAREARELALDRLRAHLAAVLDLASRGIIPAAREALDDAQSDLGDLDEAALS